MQIPGSTQTLAQSLLRHVKSGANLWIVIPPIPTIDHVAATLALWSFCKTRGADVFCVMPPTLLTNERFKKLFPELLNLKHPVTSFGTQVVIELENHALAPATLEHNHKTLRVIIPGTKRAFVKDITPWQSVPDAVFILDIPHQASLESGHAEHAVSIRSSHTVLISTHLETDPWGDQSIINPKLSGLSELIAQTLFLDELGYQLPKQDLTTLYVGIIDSTKGFTTKNQFPHTYTTTAQLIERGADHTNVIESLYFSKELKELKIWGRALARLERDVHRKIVWTHISQSDLDRTSATPEEARSVLDELIGQTPGSNIAVLSIEHEPNRVEINIRSAHHSLPLTELFWKYSPIGDNSRIVFILQQSLLASEQEVLRTLIEHSDRLRGV